MAVAKAYTQAGYEPPAVVFLDEETYRTVLPVWVKACVDAILYFRQQDGSIRMVIGKRKILPQQDWWIFGGRIFVRDDGFQAALARKLREETGLTIDVQRIPVEAVRIHFYRWSDDHSVVSAPVFRVEITEDEFREMITHLPQNPEYEAILAVDPREVRNEAKYHPAVRDCAAVLLPSIEA